MKIKSRALKNLKQDMNIQNLEMNIGTFDTLFQQTDRTKLDSAKVKMGSKDFEKMRTICFVMRRNPSYIDYLKRSKNASQIAAMADKAAITAIYLAD